MTVKLNTQSVNRHGYRILSAGIRLEAFRRNPVLLCQHDDWSRDVLPIGKVNNVRLDGNDLVGDLEFDPDDKFAQKVKGKFERKYMSAVSVQVRPLARDESPEQLEAGQRRPTITESELLEVSVVKVPGNGEAVRLHLDGGDLDDVLPVIRLSNQPAGDSGAVDQNEGQLKDIALKLGLSADATEAQIGTAIDALNAKLAANDARRAEDMVTQALSAGKIEESEKDTYLKLANADYDSTAELLSARKAPEHKQEKETQLQDVLKNSGQQAGGPETDAAKFIRLSKEDERELIRLRDEEPAVYRKLALAYSKSLNK